MIILSRYNLTQVTEFAQAMISQYLQDGDKVIDCTMGNGHDTLFLANRVGIDGKVISFDIQARALEITKKMIEDNKLDDSVVLIHDSHENIDLYVKDKIAGAMFNLGYLPGGDHNLATKAHSTIHALKKCLFLLKPKGAITIVIYYGHGEGNEEKEGILDYVKVLNPSLFHVIKVEYFNQLSCPPIIVTIIKK